jgi:hypothetical protein
MTSLPYRAGGLQEREISENFEQSNEHNNSRNNEIVIEAYLRSSIPLELLKIRHIKSILIKNVCDGCETLNELSLPKSKDDLQSNLDLDKKDYHSHNSETQEGFKPQKALKRGKSSYNLKSHIVFDTKNTNDYNNQTGTPQTESCRNHNSTILNQSNEIQRQLEFQSINEKTFFDCFYTISDFLKIDKSYFISRIFPSHVDLADEIELHIFSKSATINLFIRHESQPWKLLRQYHLKLSLLVNLGDDLELIEKHLHHIHNLLLLKMSDDCYYMLPNNNVSRESIRLLKLNYSQKILEKIENFHYKPTSCTYDQIMTLNNYSRCNHDLLFTKQALSDRISKGLENENSYYNITDKKNTLSSYIKSLNVLIASKLSHNHHLEQKVKTLKKLKTQKKERIKNLRYFTEKLDKSINIAEESEDLQIKNMRITSLINFEKSRISFIIQFIFPMVPVEGKYDFSLFGICFPSSLIPERRRLEHAEHSSIIPISILSLAIIQRITQLSKQHTERLNSMIGYISLVIIVISDIFHVPLRYPLHFLGSSTYINDPIFNMNRLVKATSANLIDDLPKQSSIYPLFICQNATLAIKFSYGLLLLRKNLEQLYETEDIVKVEEFNLLVACKIWLTCIEGYADISSNNDNDKDNYNRENIYAVNKTVLDGDVDEFPKSSFTKQIGNRISTRLNHNKANRNCSDSSKLSRISNASVTSRMSRETAVSGVSNISIDSNSVVNEFNHKLLSEERIKHIKKHLLKGSNGNL